MLELLKDLGLKKDEPQTLRFLVEKKGVFHFHFYFLKRLYTTGCFINKFQTFDDPSHIIKNQLERIV